MSKRWGKAPGQDREVHSDDFLEDVVGTMVPMACSGAQGEQRAHPMPSGESPYGSGICARKRWTAGVAEGFSS